MSAEDQPSDPATDLPAAQAGGVEQADTGERPTADDEFIAEVVPPRDKAARRLAGTALWLALMGVIAAGGLGIGAWLRNQQLLDQEAAVNERLSADTRRSSALREDFGNLDSRMQSLGSRAEQADAELRRVQLNVASLGTRQDEAEAALSRLSKLIQGGREVWQLGEIEHLLLVANDRVQLQADADGAIRALLVADQRTAQLGDPQLFPVREEIARELNALRATPRIDIQALALRLGSLAEGVSNLRLQSAPNPEFRARREQRSVPDSAAAWDKLLGSVQDAFFSLLTVRRDEARHEPLMAPDQEYYLYQNLRLQIEAARVAVLRRDTANFRASLRSAESWLLRYFASDKPAVKAALATVTELQSQELNPTLPDLSGSLQALRTVLESE